MSFLECDWSEIVDRKVLEAFALEIEKRRRTRREKLVKEEKDRENEERSRRFGRRPMGSFANYSEDDNFVGSKSQDSEDVKWVIANALASVQSGHSSDSLSTSPAVPQLATSMDTSIARTVWGTPRIAPSSTTTVSIATPLPPSTPKEAAGDESDEPGESGGMWIQNWEEMLKADKADASKGNNSKRKKGKKLVLMSNSVQRGI